METNLEKIITTKCYNELTQSELADLAIYCSNEIEFNLLKEVYLSSANQYSSNSQPSSGVKMKLDELFSVTYPEKTKNRIYLNSYFFKGPFVYLAAASLIFLVSFLFFKYTSSDKTSVAKSYKIKNKSNPLNKVKKDAILAEVPADKKVKLAVVAIPKKDEMNSDKGALVNEESIELAEIASFDQESGVFAFSIDKAREDALDDSKSNSALVSPIIGTPEMLTVLFAAY